MSKKILLGSILFLLILGTTALAFLDFRSNPSSKSLVKNCPNCNVVVILIDTLRADRLKFYGHPKSTAPFLETLAEKSTVFERAFSASSWTAPATASIFTSLYPSQHGVITGLNATNLLRRRNPEVTIDLNRIPPEIPTMGELMAKAGFNTIGVADNPNIGDEMGFSRGFQMFKKYKDEGSPTLLRTTSNFLDRRDSKSPYFLYLHFMDPHIPYLRQKPWYKDCLNSPLTNYPIRIKTQCAYESEIGFVDSQIAILAKKYNWTENSLVIVTSDHGEEFWEHGEAGHGHTLYRELVQVPLLVYHPHYKASRAPLNVSSMDILPTLADFSNIPIDPHWQGRSLEPLMRGVPAWSDQRDIYSERLRDELSPKPEFRSLVSDQWHYIETTQNKEFLKRELFDLDQDFIEVLNRYAEDHPIVKAVAGKLSSTFLFTTMSKEKNKVSIKADEEMLKKLKSLGYTD